jgi:hypothetical protein
MLAGLQIVLSAIVQPKFGPLGAPLGAALAAAVTWAHEVWLTRARDEGIRSVA